LEEFHSLLWLTCQQGEFSLVIKSSEVFWIDLESGAELGLRVRRFSLARQGDSEPAVNLRIGGTLGHHGAELLAGFLRLIMLQLETRQIESGIAVLWMLRAGLRVGFFRVFQSPELSSAAPSPFSTCSSPGRKASALR